MIALTLIVIIILVLCGVALVYAIVVFVRERVDRATADKLAYRGRLFVRMAGWKGLRALGIRHSAIGIFTFIITAVCFWVILVIVPNASSEEGIHSFWGWICPSSGGLFILTALATGWIKGQKFFVDLLGGYNEHRERLRNISMTEAATIPRVNSLLAGGSTDPALLTHTWQNLMECVRLHVEDAISATAGNNVCATLLAFTDQGVDKMVKLAQSPPSREGKGQNSKYYATSELVASRTINEGNMTVCHDLRYDTDTMRNKILLRKHYRTIVSWSITQDGKVYGALSVDITRPYSVAGRESDVDACVQPYLVTLALTLSQRPISMELPA